MKVSNFFLTSTVIKNFRNTKEEYLIKLIFPDSDIKDHLVEKLYRSGDDYATSLIYFYEMLDTDLKKQFDNWFDNEVEILKNKFES